MRNMKRLRVFKPRQVVPGRLTVVAVAGSDQLTLVCKMNLAEQTCASAMTRLRAHWVWSTAHPNRLPATSHD